MVAEIYGELQAVAKDVLTEFSQGTHKYVAPEAVTGGTPDAPTVAPGAQYPYEGVSRGVSWKYQQMKDIATSDLQTTMPGGIVVPELAGFIVQPNGSRGKIVKIDPKPASGPAVAYVIVYRV